MYTDTFKRNQVSEVVLGRGTFKRNGLNYLVTIKHSMQGSEWQRENLKQLLFSGKRDISVWNRSTKNFTLVAKDRHLTLDPGTRVQQSLTVVNNCFIHPSLYHQFLEFQQKPKGPFLKIHTICIPTIWFRAQDFGRTLTCTQTNILCERWHGLQLVPLVHS